MWLGRPLPLSQPSTIVTTTHLHKQTTETDKKHPPPRINKTGPNANMYLKFTHRAVGCKKSVKGTWDGRSSPGRRGGLVVGNIKIRWSPTLSSVANQPFTHLPFTKTSPHALCFLQLRTRGLELKSRAWQPILPIIETRVR